MRELDPRAQRELDERVAAARWLRWPVWARLALVLLRTALAFVPAGVFLYFADPRWWWAFVLPAFAVAMLLQLAYVFAPEATFRFVHRMGYVSDEDAGGPSTIP
jgi:hypothetical protein